MSGWLGIGVDLWHLLGQRVAVCQRHRPLRRLSNCSPEIIQAGHGLWSLCKEAWNPVTGILLHLGHPESLLSDFVWE